MKKNGLNYKFMASLFSFLFSCAGIIATTFAWFAISSSTSVNDLEFGIRSEDKINVGVRINDETDAKNYGVKPGEIYYPKNSVLTNLELIDLGLINRYHTYTPVSSVYQSEWDGIKDFPELKEMPTSDDQGGTTIASNNGFYQIEFYFKATENMYLYLDNKTTVKPDIFKNQEVAIDSIHLEALNKVSESLRIGFYVDRKFTIYEPNTEVSSQTPLFGRLDLDGDGYYDYINESIENEHEILFGEYKYPERIIYGSPTIIPNQKPLIIDCFTADTLSGMTPVDVAASIENGIEGAIQKTRTLQELSTKNSENTNALTYLYKNVDKRFVISIWAEGWDKDCTAQISDSSFLIDLVFGGNYGKQISTLQND